MDEKPAMKAHRALTRWSRIADLVPEWMWWAHVLGAAAFALVVTIRWGLGPAAGFAVWIATAALLTLGLFRRGSALLVASATCGGRVRPSRAR